MQVKGWLLDVRINEDTAHLWVKSKDERREYICEYHPDFYLLPKKFSYEGLLDLFDEHPHIHSIEKSKRFAKISDSELNTVFRIIVDSSVHFRSLYKLLEKYGEVFDIDLSHTQRFLADNNLIPFGEILLDSDPRGKVQSIEPVAPDLKVEPPPFKLICFEIYHEAENLTIITYDERMQEKYAFTGTESVTLNDFLEFIEDTDPDLISSFENDMKIFIKLCTQHKKLSLGSYQQKIFNLHKGRVFLSLQIYKRTSLAGIVERVMYTREIPRVGSEYAAGRAIESRQSYEARRLGYLLPRRGFYQPVMSLQELLSERDHGSLIFSPSVGLHENVASLDFESMFPHLILKENISYENVHSNREPEGFLLDFTRDTLNRRLYYKHFRKELIDKPDEWFWCETRQQALKEILFCTYGYSGCWANKFGNMDTFMEINKEARKNLVYAMNIARAKGFHTIYGNSDSLFLKKPEATLENYENIASLIQHELDLPITLENHFKYLVLLPQKTFREFGAINRYYGIRYDGELICRGIELRRRNTPRFIASTQKEAIHLLLSQSSKEEVLTKGIEAVTNLILKASNELKHGRIPIHDLEAKTILRRRPLKYKVKLPHVAAAKTLEIHGNKVERGSLIKYIYIDSEHNNPFRRVSPSGYHKKYDSKKYIHLLKEAKKSILLPFGEKVQESEKVSLSRFF
jgi:DNA polymerase elongation subunit (family B)